MYQKYKVNQSVIMYYCAIGNHGQIMNHYMIETQLVKMYHGNLVNHKNKMYHNLIGKPR